MLDELKAVLKWHCSNGETIDQFFNRQMHERILDRRLTQPLADIRHLQLSDEEVTVKEELWSIEQFKVFPRWHTLQKPARTDIPLVVFRGWKRLLLIDGQSRINLWTDTRNDGPHRVLVVEPKSDVADPFKTGYH
jgi:hypothetical protein